MINKKKIYKCIFEDFGFYFIHSFLFVRSLLCAAIEPVGNKNIYKPWIIFSRDLSSNISNNNTPIT